MKALWNSFLRAFSNPRTILAFLMMLSLFFGGLALYLRMVLLDVARPEDFGPGPEFTLIERSGQPLTSAQLAGNMVVMNFIFTRCAGPCPLMSQKMARIQSETRELADVRLVSVSVDPLADTPDALSAYAQKFHADPQRWFFATGGVVEIYDMIEKGYKLLMGPRPDLTQVGPGDLIIHTTRFVVLDKKNHIRAWLESQEPDFHTRLMRTLEALRQES